MTNIKRLVFILLMVGKTFLTTAQVSVPSVDKEKVSKGPGGVLADMQLWLKANSGVNCSVDGCTITSWADQSVNAFTVENSSNFPTLKIGAANFNPTIDFDRSGSQYLNISAGFEDFTNGITAFVVVKPTSPGAYERFFDLGNNDENDNVLISRTDTTTGMSFHTYDDNTSIGADIPNVIVDNALQIISVENPSGVVGDIVTPVVLNNGINLLNTVDCLVPNVETRTTNYIARSNWSGDAYYNGEIAEIILYNTDLSATDREKIQSYLAIKYGITLGNNTNVINYVNSDQNIIWQGNPSYQNDVFGIGRDDASELDQSRSTAITSPLVTFDHSSSLPVDLSFMIAGHDLNGLGSTTKNLPSGTPTDLLSWMGRKWYLQEFGTVGSVTLSIKKDGLTSFDQNEPIYLITSDDESFTSNVQFISMIDNGSVFEALVDLGDDSYFSFGGKSNNQINSLAFVHVSDEDLGGGEGISVWDSEGNGLFEKCKAFTGELDRLSITSTEISGRGGDEFTGFADLNNDGLADLVHATTENANSIYAYFSKGDGYFEKTAISTEIIPVSNSDHFVGYQFNEQSFLSDLNLDGNIDFITIDQLDSIRIWRGNGDGTFQRASIVDHLEGNSIYGAVGVFSRSEFSDLVDVNNDGYPDLVHAMEVDDQSIDVYLNNGEFNFESVPIKTINISNVGVGVEVFAGQSDSEQSFFADVTADGNIDYVFFSENGPVAVWKGNGDGTFSTSSPILTNGFSVSFPTLGGTAFYEHIQLIDLNGDDFPDLVFSHDDQGDNSGIYTYLGNGDGTFQTNFLSTTNSDRLQNFQSGITNDQKFSAIVPVLSGVPVFTNLACNGFVPGGVQDAENWYRADLGTSTTTNSTDNALWENNGLSNDKAIAGIGTATYRSEGINFNPSLEFVALENDQYKFETSSKNKHTIFAVFSSDQEINPTTSDWYSGNGLVDAELPGFTNDGGLSMSNGELRAGVGNPDITIQTVTNTLNDGYPHLASFTRDRNNIGLFADGLLEVSRSDVNVNTFFPESYTVGSINTNINYFDGQIPEVIIYNYELTPTDRNKVESYLAIKYGITLGSTISPIDYTSSDGTVIWEGNSDYQNQITGIGFDTISVLDQRISRSQTVNGGLLLAHGSFNSPESFDSNNSFLMIGCDNAAYDFVKDELPDGYNAKFDTEWKVKKTGFVKNVAIGASTKGLYFTSNNPFDYYLIIDRDNNGNFSNGTIDSVRADSIVYQGEEFGHVLYFNDVNLEDGNIFTFATIGRAPGGLYTDNRVWFMADDGVEENTTITSWKNQILGGIGPLLPVNSPMFIDSLVNFNPGIQLKTDDILRVDNYLGIESLDSSENTIFMVSEYKSGSVIMQNQGFLNSSNRFGTSVSANKFLVEFPDNQVINRDESISDINDGYHLYTSSTSIFTDSLFLESKLESTSPGGTLDVFTDFHFSLGGDYFGFNKSEIDVSEIIYFARKLGKQERLKVETYLAIKYGLTLGDSSNLQNYISSVGDTMWIGSASYQNNIAGLGRDDATGLNQLKSMSQNNNAILTIAHNTIDQPLNFSSDRSFLLWGSKIGKDTLSWVSSSILPVVQKKINRDWKIIKHGDVENTALSFNVASLNTSSNTKNDYVLILDSDEDLSNGVLDTVKATSLIDGVITFSNVDFDSISYFTIGLIEEDMIANTDSTAISEDDPIAVINILSNDIAIGSTIDTTSLEIILSPVKGSAIINVGALEYLVSPDSNGIDSLQYAICNSAGFCDTTWVMIVINPIADAPNLQSDQIIVTEDTLSAAVNVLINDFDVENDLDSSSLSIITNPSNGIVDSISNGNIYYTPDTNYFGDDLLIYQLCDESFLCSEDTLFITVLPVNDAPQILDQNNNDTETLQLNVFTNDSTEIKLTVVDIENDVLTISNPISGPEQGEITFINNADTSFVYLSFQDYEGPDSVLIEVCDNGDPSLCDSVKIVITVIDTHTVVISYNAVDDQKSIKAGCNIDSINVWENDDFTTALFDDNSFELLPPYDTSFFSFKVSSGIIYLNNQNDTLEAGNYNVRYKSCLIENRCDTALLAVEVLDNVPPITTSDEFSLLQGSNKIINSIHNDSDEEGLDVQTLGILNDPIGQYTVLQNGEIIIDYADTSAFIGVDTLHYQICDVLCVCSNDLIKLTISPDPQLFKIYEAFSPNGDQLNDTWVIDQINLYPSNTVKVFNRWGQLVYTAIGYDNTTVFWDGTSTEKTVVSKKLPDGSYFYLIDLNIEGIPPYRGYVVLNR